MTEWAQARGHAIHRHTASTLSPSQSESDRDLQDGQLRPFKSGRPASFPISFPSLFRPSRIDANPSRIDANPSRINAKSESDRHLQDGQLRPHPGADLIEEPDAERPAHVPQDAQLVEERRGAAPANGEVAPHLL